ncbi:hypothetical protein EJ04DRAFT_442739 [Polyplosphaeria fusca]|uniref:Uncharacterized protein n=1 Tax=Polyplosphaeria fusca TaxID=682080 RepID=A0A9P4QSD0_9PLEO|nr:hypothetical protein EJ04DRAFT_442739 [Polyplosphaeria fusca]
MANPNRTAYSGPPLSGPGIILANSIPRQNFAEDVYNQWYQEVHVPDVLSAKPGGKGVIAAWRFKSQDSTRHRPYLALYSVPNMAFIQSREFRQVNQYSQMLPEGGPSQKSVDFDTRFYQRVQIFEKPEKELVGIGRVLKCTAIQPAPGTEENFNRWYDEEHLEQVSQMSGWRKSTRYELIFKVQSRDDPRPEEAPKYLAIHEFEEGTNVQRMLREEWTERTKEMVESALEIDEGTFDYLWGMGADNAGL